MPRSSASRGDLNCTRRLSTRYSPASGKCTPARILINVLLPAPLSPSRQCTSPRFRRNVTPLRAITAPKYLLMPSSWTMYSMVDGPPTLAAAAAALPPAGADPRLGPATLMDRFLSSPAECYALADVGVEQHGGKQHRAEEDTVPVVVDAGVPDADLHDAEDQRADRRADHRAIAPAQQASADHRSDDRFELLLQTPVGRSRPCIGDLQDRKKRGTERRHDEQTDLDARNRHTGVLRGVRVPAHRHDPVTASRARQHEAADGRQQQPPDDHFRHTQGERLTTVFRRDPAPTRHGIEKTLQHMAGEQRGEQA